MSLFSFPQEAADGQLRCTENILERGQSDREYRWRHARKAFEGYAKTQTRLHSLIMIFAIRLLKHEIL